MIDYEGYFKHALLIQGPTGEILHSIHTCEHDICRARREKETAMTSAVDYWTCTDPENLTHDSPDEAVGEYLDNLETKHWPTTLTVQAYVRQVVDDDDAERAIDNGVDYGMENFFESLDETYNCGDDCDPSEDEELKKELAACYRRALVRYFVWSCEHSPDLDEQVNIAAWVRKNRPDWAEEQEIYEWLIARDEEEEA